jgi:thymidine kinase
MHLPELCLYTGPMFSSKTTRLLLAVDRAKRTGKICLAFKAALDGRYHLTNITTHMGWSLQANTASTGSDILKFVKSYTHDFNKIPGEIVVVVDEAFMIEDSAAACIELFRLGYTVHVASIQLSSDGKSFEEIEKLMPFATNINICTAVCSVCGADAHYTMRLAPVTDLIHVGGQQSYEPRCWLHFDKMRIDE